MTEPGVDRIDDDFIPSQFGERLDVEDVDRCTGSRPQVGFDFEYGIDQI
jgi:hypothetical protein